MVLKFLSKNEESGKYEFNVEELKVFLEPHHDKFISVISVAGAFRTGKSFLQNWIIKYLQEEWQVFIYKGNNITS